MSSPKRDWFLTVSTSCAKVAHMEKEERLNIRLSKEDKRKLDELSDAGGESMSLTIRELIRKAHFEMEYQKTRVSGGT